MATNFRPSLDPAKHYHRSTLENSRIAGFTNYPAVGLLKIQGPFESQRPNSSRSIQKVYTCQPAKAADEPEAAPAAPPSTPPPAEQDPFGGGEADPFGGAGGADPFGGGGAGGADPFGGGGMGGADPFGAGDDGGGAAGGGADPFGGGADEDPFN